MIRGEIHPDTDVMVISPISPFSLSTRPIVVGSGNTLNVCVESEVQKIMIDGNVVFNFDDQKTISVSLSGQELTLYRQPDYDFYEAIRSKLGWANSIK